MLSASTVKSSLPAILLKWAVPHCASTSEYDSQIVFQNKTSSDMSKTKPLRNFEFGNATDTGLIRNQNEDYLGYFECINGHVFLVCDGMGGHVGGSTASRLAVDSVRSYLENHYFDMPEDALRSAIEFANGNIYRKAVANPELMGMGTTIAMSVVKDDKIWFAHAGDSRIYLFSQNNLYRLTRDHSYVQGLVDAGQITDEEAETHPRKNEITRALGIMPEIDIEISSAPVIPANGDIFMMCSDGLNSMLSAEVISGVLSEDISVQHKAIKLVQLANEAGGTDNITLQLIWFFNVANRKSRFVPASKAVSPVFVPEPQNPAPVVKNQFPEQENETVADETDYKQPLTSTKKSRLPLPGFYSRLSQGAKRKIHIVLIAAGIFFLAYVFWDLFIRQGAPPAISNPVAATTDTGATSKDSIKTENQKALPSQQKTSDTVWLSYRVGKGDVLGKISEKFNIKIAFLKAKNNLKNDNIREGQKLNIPLKANHTVTKGETPAGIAKKYNVSESVILRANGLKPDVTLPQGKQLYIPFP
jgi:serine/threonine protein phosphatase PrpC/LysM repeat protein